MTRPATKIAKTYELGCPHCAGDIPAPCGSLYWTVEEMDMFKNEHGKRQVTCDGCGASVRIPRG